MIRSTLITGEGTRPHRVILYKREHDLHPWVVHYQLEDGSRWQGSYCERLDDAAREFHRRCKLHRAEEETLTVLMLRELEASLR